MSEPDYSPRDRALDAFLLLIGEKGFGGVSLGDVAHQAGLGLAELYGLFPDKVALASGFMARVDGQVLAGTATSTDPEETARDRLFDVMMRRYDALKPYRAVLRAFRQAMTSDPLTALALSAPLRRSMACMLEAASISADGISGAARQNGLIAIHYTVSGVFDRDDTADLSKTMAALDRRLKTAEKWVQLFERYGKSLPAPSRAA
ncbi:MAG TPA: TetR/AcrR family transcriptional regulator [Reyranellaceae bacterium]|nr:TetR/AcrR family transcriptional regulator [Reyranellaceae bacterium]